MNRLWTVVKKEFLHIWRDPRTLALIIALPAALLILLGYGVSGEQKDIPMAVADFSKTDASRRYIDYYVASGDFAVAYDVSSEDELRSDAYQIFVKGVFRQIKALDDEMGKLLAYLKTENLEENTLLVYTADQGYMLGQHGGLAEKRPAFEESLSLPFIVKYPPMIKKGSVNKDLLTCLDIPATFLELAGLPPEPKMQGRSIMPLLGGLTPSDWRKAFFYQHFGAKFTHYGIRTDRYKYYTYVLDGPDEEFYDLHKNPQEIQNQINEIEYGPQVKACRETTARLMDELGITKEMTEKPSYIWWRDPKLPYDWDQQGSHSKKEIQKKD